MNENPKPHLRLATARDQKIAEQRAHARARFLRRYPEGDSRRTMLGALDRLARSFTNGAVGADEFPWELLCDDDLSQDVYDSITQHYAAATCKRDASALRMMLHACWREGLMDFEQMKAGSSFPTKKGLTVSSKGRTLTDDEVSQFILYDRPGAPKTLQARDRALVLLLASTGARRMELSSLDVDQVDLGQREIHLRKTKNGQPRSAWLHPVAEDGLGRWLELRGSMDGPLLLALSRTGRPLHGRRLSTHQIWKILQSRSVECGIGKVAPHDMRRFVVSRLLEGGTDLALVSRLVGHKDPSVTVLYDKRPDRLCREAVENLALKTLPEQLSRTDFRSANRKSPGVTERDENQ